MHRIPAASCAQFLVYLSLLTGGWAAIAEPAGDEPAGQAAEPDSDEHAGQAAKPAPSRRTRLVYACRDAGTPVFSDRPCGASAHAWRLDLPPPAAAGAAPSTRAAKPAAATRPIVARETARAAAPPPGPDRCARLSGQLAAIDAQMRSGYSAREAARLWQRWRDAKKRLRDAKC